ncbi:MAG TPA: hypothetical protein P5572_06475 [Phycisphaerae bacterium]|nr:hypothetical protein [Phycisphaerales bacterium]HRX84650.1 hypothetical protein [Phycisphaerae bacterium]
MGPASRRPYGALVALCVVIITHLIVSLAIYPEPMPRRDLRRKLAALTGRAPAQLIVAGDSRAECGILPATLAGQVGIPANRAINMGSPACDLPGVLAGYRAFANRFDPHPILIVSVSLVEFNDRAAHRLIGDETLWSLGPLERLRLATPKRALTSLFLPERELLSRMLVEPFLLDTHKPMVVSEQGYRGQRTRRRYPPQLLEHDVNYLNESWFNDPQFQGVRWRLFRQSVQALRDAGAQVVLLDSPEHPQLVQAMRGTPMETQDEQFHKQLAQYCRDNHVPLLRYTAESLCADAACAADPGSSFVSLVHVNRTGAERLTARVGEAVSNLIATGVLHRPGE